MTRADTTQTADPGFSIFDKANYIFGLDGLRAISLLLVMVSHYGFGKIVPGGFGVTIFFFISGFLITSLLRAEQQNAGKINVRNFYVRRFLRLAPELYAFLALSVVIGFTYHAALPTWPDVFGAIFYVTNYLHLPELHWTQLWSLAVEEHFYLTFPLMFALLGRKPKQLALFLGVVCVACLAWRLTAFIGLHFPESYTYKTSECRIDSIAWGCLASVLFNRYGNQWKSRTTPAALAFAAGVFLLLLCLVVRGEVFRATLRYSIQGVGLFLLFAGLFFWPMGEKMRKALEFPLLRWMGRRSYGAYLWHYEAVRIAVTLHPGGFDSMSRPMAAAVALAAIVVSFGIAEFSYRFLLAPFAKLRRRFGSHSPMTAQAPVPSPAHEPSSLKPVAIPVED